MNIVERYLLSLFTNYHRQSSYGAQLSASFLITKKYRLSREHGAEIIEMGDEVLFADDRIAVTGGASTPHAQMTQVYDYYTTHGYTGRIVALEEVEGEYG